MPFALMLSLAVALPDPTQLRPERLLGQAELTFDGGFAGGFSQTTKTPSGGFQNQPYSEVTMRAKVGVGITDFLKFELTLPFFDAVQAPRDDLAMLRFGDPTIGLTGGGRIKTSEASELQIAPLAELIFPTARRIVLRPRGAFLDPVDRGIVLTTGGITGILGALFAWNWMGEKAEMRLSVRGYYRVRSNNASHGAGVDARVQAVLFHHLILGGRVDFLYPFFGGEQGMVSPSRLADSAGWLDATVQAGVRFFPQLDLVAAFGGPLYVVAGGYPLNAQLLLSYAFQP